MEFIPPLARRLVISGRTSISSIPFTCSMLKPLTDASKKSDKVKPWKNIPRKPATALDKSIIGIVGFFITDPAKTMMIGISNKIFQWNICSRFSIMPLTVSDSTDISVPALSPSRV